MNPIRFTVLAIHWFDSVSDSTHHSVRITRHRDGATLHFRIRYGYGEQYRYAVLACMAKAGWLPPRYREPSPHGGLNVLAYERENNYPILWQVSDRLKC